MDTRGKGVASGQDNSRESEKRCYEKKCEKTEQRVHLEKEGRHEAKADSRASSRRWTGSAWGGGRSDPASGGP